MGVNLNMSLKMKCCICVPVQLRILLRKGSNKLNQTNQKMYWMKEEKDEIH